MFKFSRVSRIDIALDATILYLLDYFIVLEVLEFTSKKRRFKRDFGERRAIILSVKLFTFEIVGLDAGSKGNIYLQA